MPRPLGTLAISQLLNIISAVEKPFENRKTKWEHRRRVRYREMEDELKQLPLSIRAGKNQALMVFQTEEPNQEVHRRVKRLIANKPRIEVIIYDTDAETKQLGQSIKDALKSLYKWMNRGKVPAERKVVEYQQADGLGIFKLDFVADYSDDALQHFDPDVLELDDDSYTSTNPTQTKARDDYRAAKESYLATDENDMDAPSKAYKDVTDKALRKCNPPFRLSAPDPLSCVYTMDGDQIDVIVEKGKRKISALLETYENHQLRLLNNHLVVWPEMTDAVSADTIPDNNDLGGDYGDMVEYIEIRTRIEVVILIRHPQLMKARGKIAKTDDYVKLSFENPFGSYSTGYVLCPGDITGSHDPANEFQPAILESLQLAQAVNVLSTIRISAAIDAALAEKYIKVDDGVMPPPQLTQATADKTPTVKDGRAVPVIPGEIRRVAPPNIDLDKAEAFLASKMAQARFQEVLGGDATSSDSGHKLAIQVSQADTQIVPYQTTRAEAVSEVLMCCLYAAKNLGQTIFVKEVPDAGNSMTIMNRTEMVQPIRALTPEMFDIDFNLVVSIGSETPVTKFAKWAALEARYKSGTLSYETLMEQSDVENVADEIARVFEGQTLVAVMQQSIPVIVKMIANRTLLKLAGAQATGASATVGEGGNESGGGMDGARDSNPIAGVGKVPGAGMSPAGPTVSEDGPRVHEGAGDGAVGTT